MSKTLHMECGTVIVCFKIRKFSQREKSNRSDFNGIFNMCLY